MMELFKVAVSSKASDVLITAGAPPMFRVRGEFLPSIFPGLVAKDTKDLLYGILRHDQIAKFEAAKELDFSLAVEKIGRFRANMFFQRGCIGGAFRLIPAQVPTVSALGLPPVLEELALQQQGLILVTGPTGHGKSTTQAAMIDIVNSRKRMHVVTIEDPIEYLHKNKKSVIEQREVGEDTESFASALKHVLRQCPDVILIGEMRDLESIASALTAAETGHLVLATLHTNDCVQAVDRLLDVFPAHQQGQVRAQLAFSLVAIIAQRLVPKTDGSGRIPAVEILRNNAAVGHLIRDGKTHQIYTIMETHARDGMCTMDKALKELYLQGNVSLEDCKARMRNPASLEKV
ncbi:MAG: type IV pilus twitching motility protein PilT [Planctomycetota bacterium]|nr:type IV pilus twitching motility protein PilT [Planctomycetota bacterium]